MKPRKMFVGRWQPFHLGHLMMVQEVLKEGHPVAIGVRNTKLDENNPFTLHERVEMIKRSFTAEDVMIFAVPDFDCICVGREPGYEFREVQLPDQLQKVSGTYIRELINENDKRWHDLVPAGAAYVIDEAAAKKKAKDQTKEGLAIMFTGLPCSGKTTLGQMLVDWLGANDARRKVFVDGDTFRATFCEELGFDKHARAENMQRMILYSKPIVFCGGVVVLSAIFPYTNARNVGIKMLKEAGNVVLIHLDTPLDVCEQRDVKGLYAAARKGDVKAMTGISDPYEAPANADLVIDTSKYSTQQCLTEITEYLYSSLLIKEE